MIEDKIQITKYLEAYHAGKINAGLATGLARLDEELRFKRGQSNFVNGHDNVGKTVFMLWYFLCLSVRHNLKWVIYSGENKSGQLVRQLIQFHTGKRLNQLTIKEVYRYQTEIEQWFTFIDNKNFYKSSELFKIFKDIECDGCLIDPFTGLNRDFTHAGNYEYLNECRNFANKTNKTIYTNTHIVSEAARKVYNEKHAYAGYTVAPSKSDSEGGQPFGNRADDFITLHRLMGHPTMKYKTLLYVRKVKDTETGGQVTDINSPIELEFNSGLGFTIDGQNILNGTIKSEMELSVLKPNLNFHEPITKPITKIITNPYDEPKPNGFLPRTNEGDSQPF